MFICVVTNMVVPCSNIREGECSAVARHVWSKDTNYISELIQESDIHRCCFLESWFIQWNATVNWKAGSCMLLCVQLFVRLLMFVATFKFCMV